MLSAIKQAAIDAVQAAGPVMVQLGVVTKTEPLTVMVDNRLELTADFLLVPDSLLPLELDLKHTHGTSEEALSDKVMIRKGLAAGDKLLLLRMQGGQQYVIFDKVGSV